MENRISGKLVQLDPSYFMQTDGRIERQTDLMKLILVCLSFANAPKIILEERNRISVYELN
jgi:hypothetical protein